MGDGSGAAARAVRHSVNETTFTTQDAARLSRSGNETTFTTEDTEDTE